MVSNSYCYKQSYINWKILISTILCLSNNEIDIFLYQLMSISYYARFNISEYETIGTSFSLQRGHILFSISNINIIHIENLNKIDFLIFLHLKLWTLMVSLVFNFSLIFTFFLNLPEARKTEEKTSFILCNVQTFFQCAISTSLKGPDSDLIVPHYNLFFSK